MSVVIPVFNNETTLEQQLDALLNQDYAEPYEIIVADNGSRDRTRSIALEKAAVCGNLRVVAAPGKRANVARNVGAAAAAGDLIAYCDGDDVVSDVWLTRLVEKAIDCDAVGGKLDRTLLNDEDVLDWRPLLKLQPTEMPLALGFLPYVPSGAFAIWADVLTDIGGWDEDFEAGTDVDISWRLLLYGYSLCKAHEAVVHYRQRRTLRALARQAVTFGKGDVMLYRKFGELGVERESVRNSLAAWRRLLLSAPNLFRSPALRGRWVWSVGYKIGRLIGSISLRTRFL